jgi:DNA-binding protein HU-beta
MNTSELINHIALQTDLPKEAAARSLAVFTEAVTSSLKKGEDVRIGGLGTFGVTRRKARTGYNLNTGEVMQIAASKRAKFLPGKALRDELN